MDYFHRNRFFILCIFFPLVSSQNWKTGEWESCVSATCGEGRRQRLVWCSDKDGFKTLEEICSARTKPIAKEDCFKVCDHLKAYLWWDIGEWTACRTFLKPNQSVSCQDTVGVSKRHVTCKFQAPLSKSIKDSAEENLITKSPKIRRVPDSACARFWDQPISETTCSYQCPRDCVILKFQQTKNSGSVKTVIIPPLNGGKPCPRLHLRSSTPCERQSSTCPSKSRLLRHANVTSPILNVGAWGFCQELGNSSDYGVTIGKDTSNQVTVIGVQKRNVTCRNYNGHVLKLEDCLGKDMSLPVRSRSCLMNVDCGLSPWSEWRVLKRGCVDSRGDTHSEIKERIRDVVRFPVGKVKPCSLTRQRIVINANLPNCQSVFKWLSLAWNSCRVLSPSSGDVSKSIDICGAGQKKRRVICVQTKDLKPVGEELCHEDKPIEMEDCYVECNRDCVLSSWSAWSHCIPVRFRDKMLKPKESYTKRTRRVIRPATGNGVCAEPLQQADDCENGVYDWKYGEWGPCQADDAKDFGAGNRSRESKCILYDKSEISSAFCEIYSVLDDNEECYLPGSEDCVISEWSKWSTCSMPCATNKIFGQKTRKRIILAYHGSRSNHSCENKELEETEDCNEWFCDGYTWKAGNWQKCQPLDGRICGEGLQHRVVWCVTDGISVKKSSCSMLPELSREQPCEVPCPIDCQLTPFSEYTECPQTCDLNARKERERYVISKAINGGKNCPLILKESRGCYESTDVTCLAKPNDYSWFLGQWSPCRPSDTVQGCGDGQQTRDVACRSLVEGSKVDPWLCKTKTSGSGLSVYSSGFWRPDGIRSCYINCSNGCVETRWLPQESCYGTCHDVVLKKDILGWVNLSMNAECKKKELSSVGQCIPPETLNVSFSNWSDCITDSECGGGFKFKRGHLINQTTCQQMGIITEGCEIECPIDCVMSEWSNWSLCTTIHSPGYRSRKRQVLQKPNEFGRKCPKTVQNETEEEFEISRSCDRYEWIADPYWSQCQVATKSGKYNCGPGLQTRKIKCFLMVDENPTELVSIDLCNALESPKKRRTCTLPCPGDCVVSDWSEWTSCNRPCDSSLNQNRTRLILRQADSERECPFLNETRSCVMGESCYDYEWVLGPWSTCVLSVDTRCGFGTEERGLLCRRHDGVEVSSLHCQHLTGFENSQLVKNCSVECVRDCQMSQWSQWDASQCRPCDVNGTYQRQRRMVAPPSELGRPCGVLEQSRPCPYETCYHWSLGSWSDCHLGTNISNVCGIGTRNRIVQCHRFDGVKVEKVHCLLLNLSSEIKSQRWLDLDWITDITRAQDEEECEIPCPGDCALTPWSEWGDCHRECLTGDTLGWRTRSRVVLSRPSIGGANCSNDLYQSLPCSSRDCIFYEWFSSDTNVIKCRRSDGLVVIGGFSNVDSHPCVMACLSLGAQTDSVAGECRCPPGSRFVVSPLDHGLEVSPTNDPSSTKDINGPSTYFGQSLGPCQLIKMGLDVSKNISEGPNIRFLPEDDEASFWMYAMISVGTAFVIFVIATIYLMCHSSLRERFLKIQRRRNLRRRSMEDNDPCSDTMLSYHSGTKTT